MVYSVVYGAQDGCGTRRGRARAVLRGRGTGTRVALGNRARPRPWDATDGLTTAPPPPTRGTGTGEPRSRSPVGVPPRPGVGNDRRGSATKQVPDLQGFALEPALGLSPRSRRPPTPRARPCASWPLQDCAETPTDEQVPHSSAAIRIRPNGLVAVGPQAKFGRGDTLAK